MHFWTSMDGISFYLAARVKNYIPKTGTVLDMWEDTAGNMIVGATNGRGTSDQADHIQSCVIFRVNVIYGPPMLVKDV